MLLFLLQFKAAELILVFDGSILKIQNQRHSHVYKFQIPRIDPLYLFLDIKFDELRVSFVRSYYYFMFFTTFIENSNNWIDKLIVEYLVELCFPQQHIVVFFIAVSYSFFSGLCWLISILLVKFLIFLSIFCFLCQSKTIKNQDKRYTLMDERSDKIKKTIDNLISFCC